MPPDESRININHIGRGYPSFFVFLSPSLSICLSLISISQMSINKALNSLTVSVEKCGRTQQQHRNGLFI